MRKNISSSSGEQHYFISTSWRGDESEIRDFLYCCGKITMMMVEKKKRTKSDERLRSVLFRLLRDPAESDSHSWHSYIVDLLVIAATCHAAHSSQQRNKLSPHNWVRAIKKKKLKSSLDYSEHSKASQRDQRWNQKLFEWFSIIFFQLSRSSLSARRENYVRVVEEIWNFNDALGMLWVCFKVFLCFLAVLQLKKWVMSGDNTTQTGARGSNGKFENWIYMCSLATLNSCMNLIKCMFLSDIAAVLFFFLEN